MLGSLGCKMLPSSDLLVYLCSVAGMVLVMHPPLAPA